MSNYFVKQININKVRHHKSINIPLSGNKKKHLILTGKNGSGKTSILEGIYKYLGVFEHASYKTFKNWYKELEAHKRVVKDMKHTLLNDNLADQRKEEYRMSIKNNLKHAEHLEELIEGQTKEIELEINSDENIDDNYQNNNFIIAYFSANRTSDMKIPRGVEKIDLQDYRRDQNVGSLFIKYLVDLKTQELFAHHEGELKYAKKLANWFKYLEENLKIIFENENLEFKYDYKNYNFQVIEPNKEPYTLNSLSSGFSSILNIVTELIMRMENNRGNAYDVQGIVLIDEIEAHLHVSLQKKILKFITDFFPNIQFIITTHSPFIINSIEDVVIFDLETQVLLEDLSNYSYRAIVEEFFNIDQYSYLVKEKVKEYQNLVEHIHNLNDRERNRLEELNMDLSKFPELHSEDIKLAKAYIDLKRNLSGVKND